MENPPIKRPGLSGYAELSRHYYDGSAITIDCYVAASSSVRGYNAYSRFKHALTDRGTIIKDDPLDADGNIDPEPLIPNVNSYSRTESIPHRNVGTIEEDKRYNSYAYVRLVVSGGFIEGDDEWFVENSETFTEDDNIETEDTETPPLQPTQWGVIKQGP